MNLTIVSLISSSTFLSSPAFIGNHIHVFNCAFMNFFPLIFYNQNNMFLQKTTFSHGLSGIISISNEIIEQNNCMTIRNESISKMLSYVDNSKPYSISIIECIFQNIIVQLNNDAAVYISSDRTTLYLTSCLFAKCQFPSGMIFLQSGSFEVTHTCFSDISTNTDKNILRSSLSRNTDFSIFLYNTMVHTGRSEEFDSNQNIQLQQGDAFLKCNNMSDCSCRAYVLESIRFLTFSMNSIIDCVSNCFYLNGKWPGSYQQVLTFVNLIRIDSDVSLFSVNINSPLYLAITDSVLFNNGHAVLYLPGESQSLYIYIENCIIDDFREIDNSDLVFFLNCTKKTCDKDYLTLLPHYTYESFCPGNEVDDKIAAFGCNVGNCFDENCTSTFSFSSGLIPFTTIHHFDLQIATFSRTFEFSISEYFTNGFSYSDFFTESLNFSNLPTTNHFSKSIFFSNSDLFSKSFTNSIQFLPSEIHTKKFSNSNFFSISNYFSLSKSFSNSNTFSPSPTQSSSNKEISYSLSMTVSYIRTVTYNLSYSLTISFYECTNSFGETSICVFEYYIKSNFYYIIRSLSPVLVPTYFEQDIKKKKKISDEKMIGIVCLPIAAVFSVAGIIILIKTKNMSDIEFDSIDDESYSNEQESNNGNEKIVKYNVTNINDDWL